MTGGRPTPSSESTDVRWFGHRDVADLQMGAQGAEWITTLRAPIPLARLRSARLYR
jgi:hypothetical protein